MAVKSSNQITVTDITDAYSVFMDSESFTFNATDSGGISGSCSTNITARCGTTAVTVSVTANQIKFYEQGSSSEMSSPPFNPTVTPSSDNKTATIAFAANSGATLTTPVEAEIPISVDSTITVTKRFSLSAAIAGTDGTPGATGKGISSVTRYFQRTNTNSAPSKNATGNPGSSWSTTMTAPDATHHFLWATDHYVYTDSTSSNGTVILASQYNDASAWFQGNGEPSASTVTTAAHVGDQYLDTSTGDVYKCTTAGTPGTWTSTGNIKGTPGTPGAAGADAISISITTNNGTVFKNNTGSTKLTAHVYKGGVEKTVTESTGVVADSLGTIKWYKGSADSTQPSGWPQSKGAITISASDVTNAQAYTCQLEG